MADLSNYARRAAHVQFPHDDRDYDGWPTGWNQEHERQGASWGILHLAERLQEPDAIEAGSLFNVAGRCWEKYGGGEEYCSHEPFVTRAEATKHRDDFHTESADVWRDDSHMERLAAMLDHIAKGAEQ